MQMKEKKASIIQAFQTKKNDSGSPEVQIALLTDRIQRLSEHLKNRQKDVHSRRGLLRMVERRKRLLAYLARVNPEQYKKILARLNLRK